MENSVPVDQSKASAHQSTFSEHAKLKVKPQLGMDRSCQSTLSNADSPSNQTKSKFIEVVQPIRWIISVKNVQQKVIRQKTTCSV